MDPCHDQHPLADFEAACAMAARAMGARGFPEITVITDSLEALYRLRVRPRTLDFERAGLVRHAVFVLAGQPEVLVRQADYLPIWREKCPTIHVERHGDVWATGTPRGEYVRALAGCLQVALRCPGDAGPVLAPAVAEAPDVCHPGLPCRPGHDAGGRAGTMVAEIAELERRMNFCDFA